MSLTIHYWNPKPVLSEVIGYAETSDEAWRIIKKHDSEHHVADNLKDYYYIKKVEQ